MFKTRLLHQCHVLRWCFLFLICLIRWFWSWVETVESCNVEIIAKLWIQRIWAAFHGDSHVVALNIVVLFAGWRLYSCCLPCNETAKSQKPTLPRAVLSLSWFSRFRQVCWEPQRKFSPIGPYSKHLLPSVPSLSSFWKKPSRSGSLCTLMFDPFGNALEWLKVWTRGWGVVAIAVGL